MPHENYGLVKLYRFSTKLGVERKICPVSYWRTVEYPWILSKLPPHHTGDLILDIGAGLSPFALFCASREDIDVIAIDTERNTVIKQHSWARNLSIGNFHAGQNDARKLGFRDSVFDKVFAISVLEHIPHYGDFEVATEIGRILKPNGEVFITLPFAIEPAEYEGKDRWYDEKTFNERIVKPSGLKLVEKEYYLEALPFLRLFHRLPQFARVPLLWLQPVIALILLRKTKRRSEKLCLITARFRKIQNPSPHSVVREGARGLEENLTNSIF